MQQLNTETCTFADANTFWLLGEAQLNNNTISFSISKLLVYVCTFSFEFLALGWLLLLLLLLPLHRTLYAIHIELSVRLRPYCKVTEAAAAASSAMDITQAEYYHSNFRINDIINENSTKWKPRQSLARSIDADLLIRTESNNVDILKIKMNFAAQLNWRYIRISSIIISLYSSERTHT